MAIKLDDQKLSYAGFEAQTAELPEATLKYLLQYGFSKSIQDASVGMKRQAEDLWNGSRKGAPFQRMLEMTGKPEKAFQDGAAFGKAVTEAYQRTRYERLKAGTMAEARPSNTRTRGVEKLIRDIATEHLRAALAKQDRRISREKFQDFLQKYMEKNERALRNEAMHRMAETDVVMDILGAELAAA